MNFCPDCGMRLVLTRKTENNHSESYLACSKCNYQRRVTSIKALVIKPTEQLNPEEVLVIDGEIANLRTMPTTRVECPKCGNMEAFWWMVQTRGADESTTQFFRCTQCKNTWREMA
jgi:DNA-directed RNA polymerase subunit M